MIMASRLEACTSVTFSLGGQRALLLVLIIWNTDVCVLESMPARQGASVAPRSLWQSIFRICNFCNELVNQHAIQCCRLPNVITHYLTPPLKTSHVTIDISNSCRATVAWCNYMAFCKGRAASRVTLEQSGEGQLNRQTQRRWAVQAQANCMQPSCQVTARLTKRHIYCGCLHCADLI